MSADQQTPFRFAFAASFTAEPVGRVVEFWAGPLHSRFQTWFAPYDQVHQTLLDPGSGFAVNERGVNVILVRLEDLGDEEATREQNLCHLLNEVAGAATAMRVPLMFTLCPPSEAAGSREFIARMSRLPDTVLQDTPGVHCLGYEEIGRLYPVENIHDAGGERLGRIPYTQGWFCALGTSIVRRTSALFRPPYKLVALDCDNTLWQGICGEDGPEGVILDPARRYLHEFMLEQRNAGVLLAMASKNNEEDVFETFRVHPEMPLQLHHFTSWRLNWDAKTLGLISIAEELGISADTFLFVDDNPRECAELRQALPEVTTIPLPADENQFVHFLQHIWAFDRPPVTEEDRNRAAYYQQTAGFGDEIRKAGSLEEFMASLQLRVEVVPLEAARMARAAQLTQRTNQFNTTTIRRTEPELAALLQEGWRIWTVAASDRFGEYGVVGVMVVEPHEDGWRLDNMALSCRALGRGVEHRMLAALAHEAGDVELRLDYRRTAKNLPARQFLESLSEGTVQTNENGFTVRLHARDIVDLRWRPVTGAAPAAPAATTAERVAAAHTRSVDFAGIATNLSSVPEILAAMHTRVTASDAETEVERELARIWSELLDKPSVRRDDNFFDLGGHSLVAVLLLMRIRETFGIELSIEDVYTAQLTLADLAARIEAARVAAVDPEEYASLLAEIENLSDEEVRELLAREESGV